jgi:hypothetical protein
LKIDGAERMCMSETDIYNAFFQRSDFTLGFKMRVHSQFFQVLKRVRSGEIRTEAEGVEAEVSGKAAKNKAEKDWPTLVSTLKSSRFQNTTTFLSNSVH